MSPRRTWARARARCVGSRHTLLPKDLYIHIYMYVCVSIFASMCMFIYVYISLTPPPLYYPRFRSNGEKVQRNEQTVWCKSERWCC